MRNYIILTACLLTFGLGATAQPGYTQYMKKEGLKIGTKWAKAKDENGEKKSALLLALDNTNEYATSFTIEIRMYYEGILRETGTIENMCLPAQKSSIGKLNGLYFIPEKFTSEQLKSSDFNLELDLLSITKVDECEISE
jgi:hypothetical protein